MDTLSRVDQTGNVTRAHYVSLSSISYLDRHSAVVWLLAIRKSILDANSWLRSDADVTGWPRSLSAAKRMSPGTKPGTPMNARFFEGPQQLGNPQTIYSRDTPPDGDCVPFLHTEMSSQGASLGGEEIIDMSP